MQTVVQIVTECPFFLFIFRSFPFSIFQGSKYGISKLKHVQEDVRRDTGNRIETWSLQRIAYLNKDDNVYVHLSMMNMPFVSTDQDVHIFGMFKLWKKVSIDKTT